MASRAELLAALTAEAHEDVVSNLLASRDVRIAVPCSLLSKGGGGGGAGSRVHVSVIRRSREGPAVALDCGKWWRGAPAGVVWMDFRQLLQHASDDTLRSLHRKLAAVTSSRSRSLTRTQSVPGRITLEEALAGGGSSSSSSHAGSSSHASSPWLHRAGSGSGAPAASSSSGSSLRRTSSTGVPADGSGSGLQRTSSMGRPPLSGGSSASAARAGGSTGLHRLSASGLRRSTSLEASPSSSRQATPERPGRPGSGASSEACTPKGPLPLSVPYEDSAGGMHVGARKAGRHGGSTGSGPDSPLSPVDLQHPLFYSEPSPRLDSSPAAGSTATSSLPSPAGSCGAASSSGGSTLARQPTFSQPYFAEFEDPSPAATASLSPSMPLSPAADTCTPPNAAPAVPSPEGSGSARAAQLAAAQEQMTAEELHEVHPSFHHVYVPPWAVPAAPPQQTVRAFREAGTQTSTGAIQARPHASHTAEDVADHFQAFMQHFAASLPHLAMALADMHLNLGGDDPLFVKSQYYFNALLHLKDEMSQLGERLQPPAP